MSMRAAMLTSDAGPAHGALLTALTQSGALAEVRTVEVGSLLSFRAILRLLAYHPDLVVTETGASWAMLAAVYRAIARRSRLVVRDDLAGSRAGWWRHLLLGCADAVLREDGSSASDRPRTVQPVFALTPPRDLEPFLACPLTRGPAEAHRLIYDGPLSPESGVVDILLALAAWAERHPGCPVEIWWVGEGDLAGVLEAQPLPETLTQQFLGPLSAEAAAAAYAQCGIMVLPGPMVAAPSPATRAVAAGLVLVGAHWDWAGRHDAGPDPDAFNFHTAEATLEAITDALGRTTEELAARRAAGRDWVEQAVQQGPADRLRHVLSQVMPARFGSASGAGGTAAAVRR